MYTINNGGLMEELFNGKQKEVLKFFQGNLNGLANDPSYNLKYVIIYKDDVSGVFDTFDEALEEAVVKYPKHDFIIQQVVPQNRVANFLYSAIS